MRRGTAIDTLKLLEQVEAIIEDAPHFIGLYKIDIDEFSMLVSKVRASLPEDVRRAGKIAQNSDRIMEAAQSEAGQAIESARTEAAQVLEQARADALRIQEEAKARAEAMVEQSEIVRIASVQAKDIIAQADTEAREIRTGADEYACDVLETLEGQIGDAMSQVDERVGGMISTIRRGRQQLEQRSARPVASEQDEPVPVGVATRSANGASVNGRG